ncbi:MAG: Rieske (2Fe-2S) protein [Deltaproteobacteria bacterium]|nr:Rieske (2Fe-2S) protein [Deltaproteobacteria bacterium]
MTTPLWRDEVSIRSADERYVSRRQLGKFLVLTSLGMLAGNTWLLIKAGLRGAAARLAPARIAAPGEPARGAVALFTYPEPEDRCLLVRTPDGQLHAFSQKCTHLSCAVVYSAARDRLECPCHDGVFSVRTGAVLAGPPPRPLPRIAVEERADGVYAIGVEDGDDGDPSDDGDRG